MIKRSYRLLRSCALATLGLMAVTSPVAAEELVNCMVSDTSGGNDEISRPFYISGYPGVTLEEVVLWFETLPAGSFSYRMTVRENAYNGAVLGQATADYTFTSGSVPVPVVFDFGRVLVSSGTTLAFTMEQTAGAGTTYYVTSHPDGCPITQTNGATPPLDSVRDDGIYALMYGSSTAPDSTGILESPSNGAALSGIGLVRGWVCDAEHVVVEMDGDPAQRYEAAYGTNRPDTSSACGDSNNGYSLLFNMNELGDGSHSVRVLVDGVQNGLAAFTVQTLGSSYLTGASGTFTLTDFPETGEDVDIRWLEPAQNFMIIDHR